MLRQRLKRRQHHRAKNIIEKDEFNDENLNETSLYFNEGESNLKDGNVPDLNMQIFNERKLNVKDFNVEEGVLRKEARYLTRNILITDTMQHVNNFEDLVNLKFLKLNHTVAIRDNSLTEDQNS